MVAHNSQHRSSRISCIDGTYNTELHPPPMCSPMTKQSSSFKLSKNSLNKAMEGGEDLHLAILSYISTPLNHNLPSPAELLNSRNF